MCIKKKPPYKTLFEERMLFERELTGEVWSERERKDVGFDHHEAEIGVELDGVDTFVLAGELELGKAARTRELDQPLQELLAIAATAVGFVGKDVFHVPHVLLEWGQKAEAGHGDRSPFWMESADPDEEGSAHDAL